MLSEGNQLQLAYTIWLHLYKTVYKRNLYLMTKKNLCYLGPGREIDNHKNWHKETSWSDGNIFHGLQWWLHGHQDLSKLLTSIDYRKMSELFLAPPRGNGLALEKLNGIIKIILTQN